MTAGTLGRFLLDPFDQSVFDSSEILEMPIDRNELLPAEQQQSQELFLLFLSQLRCLKSINRSFDDPTVDLPGGRRVIEDLDAGQPLPGPVALLRLRHPCSESRAARTSEDDLANGAF